MLVILDYGMGNLRSVEKAVEFLGFECQIQPHLKGATKLIIPGVGAFGAAMERVLPLADEIRAFANDGNPLMGICLGQQLLFETSEEYGEQIGLGLIAGRVKYFPKDTGLKIPQIGWNEAVFAPNSKLGKGSLPEDQVYFVHSLYTDCSDPSDIAAKTSYGVTFASAVEKGNIWGTQFHPEKSGEVGLRILRNFLEC
ncbi:MAG TPA: imidazole glycerol phosphate synthase subunit HisH [Fimbriimonadaceae bacterium]|jgi:glutamine amidotransferase